MAVRVETEGPEWVVVLHRPRVRNAVDRPTAEGVAAFAAGAGRGGVPR